MFYEIVFLMVLKSRVVRKINFLEIILDNFKKPWTLIPQGINLGSCDGLAYTIHQFFELLPLPPWGDGHTCHGLPHEV